MAKLHFFYSVMNAGKSQMLLQTRFNYEQNLWKTIVLTSARDDRFGVGRVASRLGASAEAIAVTPEMNLLHLVREQVGVPSYRGTKAAVLIDEVQFFTSEQIAQLSDVADDLRVPVLAYGLKNNAFGELFSPAVGTLLALADDVKEIKQICHCGRKATMILRFDDRGRIDRGGDVVKIGAEGSYVSVCRPCFKSGDIGPVARASIEGFDELSGPVVCMTCDEVFTSMAGFDPNGQQAYGCAATATMFGVSGAYGSTKIDGTSWVFKDGKRPAHVRSGTICDNCIQKLMDVGSLVEETYEFDDEDAMTEEERSELLAELGEYGDDD
jgi:thymidine kinase